MASIHVFFLSSTFTAGLWRYMVRHLYYEAMADSAQFQSKVSYKIKCAWWLTIQITKHFWPSFDNALIKWFS